MLLAVVSFVLARLTGFLVIYGWYVAFIAGTIVFFASMLSSTLLFNTYIKYQNMLQERKKDELRKLWADKEDRINVMERSFTRKRINLVNFVDPITNDICDKSFINCDIIGPVNLFVGDNCTLKGNNLFGVDVVFIKEGATVRNAVHLKNITFDGCRVNLVTFVFTENMRSNVKELSYVAIN